MNIKSLIFLAIALLLSLNGLPAHAALTGYSDQGAEQAYAESGIFINPVKIDTAIDDSASIDKAKPSNGEFFTSSVTPEKLARIPLPGAAWLLLSGIFGLLGAAKRLNKSDS